MAEKNVSKPVVEDVEDEVLDDGEKTTSMETGAKPGKKSSKSDDELVITPEIQEVINNTIGPERKKWTKEKDRYIEQINDLTQKNEELQQLIFEEKSRGVDETTKRFAMRLAKTNIQEAIEFLDEEMSAGGKKDEKVTTPRTPHNSKKGNDEEITVPNFRPIVT